MVSALRLLSLVLFVGCGSSSVGDDDDGAGLGDACSLTEPCSTGGVCDFTADGGPICITVDGDVDSDGHHGSVAVRVRAPLATGAPSMNSRGTGGIVVVAPSALKVKDVHATVQLLRMVPAPVLGVIAYD